MAVESEGASANLVTRRYTGASRLDAESGFKMDWAALSRAFRLVAEAWDDETHTLTVFLDPVAPPSDAPGSREPGATSDSRAR